MIKEKLSINQAVEIIRGHDFKGLSRFIDGNINKFSYGLINNRLCVYKDISELISMRIFAEIHLTDLTGSVRLEIFKNREMPLEQDEIEVIIRSVAQAIISRKS